MDDELTDDEVKARARELGFVPARRELNGQVVFWWREVAHPDDTRHPCFLSGAEAISYMRGRLRRERAFMEQRAPNEIVGPL